MSLNRRAGVFPKVRFGGKLVSFGRRSRPLEKKQLIANVSTPI
jgi:hypothetical protein